MKEKIIQIQVKIIQDRFHLTALTDKGRIFQLQPMIKNGQFIKHEWAEIELPKELKPRP